MKPKRTILCVDDNEQSLSIRKVMLETRGYRVIACSSGEEALERFKRGGVDLVLTDLIMPGVDGASSSRPSRQSRLKLPQFCFPGKSESTIAIPAPMFPAQGHVRARGIAGAHPFAIAGTKARPPSGPVEGPRSRDEAGAA